MRTGAHGQLALLAAAVLVLAGCGPVSGVMLAGNVVSAAGAAAMDAARDARRAEGDAIRARGVDAHLALLGAQQGRPQDALQLAINLTERRDAEAFRWMCQAAMAGVGPAQLQLGHWYNEDRLREDLWPFIRVTPDNRMARAWYRAAAHNGEHLAAIYGATLPLRNHAAAVPVQVMASDASPGPLPDCAGGLWLTSPRTPSTREG